MDIFKSPPWLAGLASVPLVWFSYARLFWLLLLLFVPVAGTHPGCKYVRRTPHTHTQVAFLDHSPFIWPHGNNNNNDDLTVETTPAQPCFLCSQQSSKHTGPHQEIRPSCPIRLPGTALRTHCTTPPLQRRRGDQTSVTKYLRVHTDSKLDWDNNTTAF